MRLKKRDLPPNLLRQIEQADKDAVRAEQKRRLQPATSEAKVEYRPARMAVFIPQTFTTTHHDKRMGFANGRPVMFDSEALKAVKRMLAVYIRPAGRLRPAPPYVLEVEFRFRGKAHGFWEQKPDWDNAAKPIGDALQKAGWVSDDKRIVMGVVRKVTVPDPEPTGIAVQLATIAASEAFPRFGSAQQISVTPF